ncbi:hypothetical protein MMA231_02497 [Asticcacaulis sp. MM231]|uniref:phage tail assembly protein n=1 Tax=Asticcacaulis sp. MM231 TaxID=3157666 RepID=UPI0032D5768E
MTTPVFSDPIPLSQPIKHGDTEITSLTLRKPQPGEMRGLQLSTLQVGDFDQHIKLIPRIAQPLITEQDVAAMDACDFADCVDTIVGFLLHSRQRALLQTA